MENVAQDDKSRGSPARIIGTVRTAGDLCDGGLTVARARIFSTLIIIDFEKFGHFILFLMSVLVNEKPRYSIDHIIHNITAANNYCSTALKTLRNMRSLFILPAFIVIAAVNFFFTHSRKKQKPSNFFQ